MQDVYMCLYALTFWQKCKFQLKTENKKKTAEMIYILDFQLISWKITMCEFVIVRFE